MASIDFTGETPTSGDVVEFYWAPSTDSTAANGNVGANSGADAACPDGSTIGTLAEFVNMCIFIGNLALSDDGAVQTGYVGQLWPPTRYGQLIVKNESGDAFEADAVESHVVFIPLVHEIQ
jgi:hypothetical protein